MTDLKQLQIACAIHGISISAFAKKIGKSRSALYEVALGNKKTSYITEQIRAFVGNAKNQLADLHTPTQSDQWLTTAEFSAATGMNVRSIANKANRGGFPVRKCRRVKGKWLIHSSLVEMHKVKAEVL